MNSAIPGLHDLITEQGASRPDAHFLENARTDAVVSYSRLASLLHSVGRALEARDAANDVTVLVDIDDPVDFAVAHVSAIALGKRSVPVDPDLGVGELTRLAALLDSPPLVITDRPERAEAAGLASVSWADIRSGRFATGASLAPPTGPGSALLFTSGSTGTPKGVELSEHQLLFVADAIVRHNRLTRTDRGFNPLPLFHINAEVVGVLATLTAGATLVLDRRFHRTRFWELLAERRVTWLNAVPAILAVLAHSGAVRPPESLRFIRSASSPLPGPVRQAFDGIPVVVSYGMTEAASQITATPLAEQSHHGSVGIPVGTEVEARDAAGASVPAGEIGALWIRGAGVITSYLGGRAADRFDAEGWLSTGDLGSIDVDGYVTLAGRSDDVINRGGEKVYPLEIEELFTGDDAVREAVVVAHPHPVLGSVPVAYIIPAEARRTAESDAAIIARLQDLSESGLARFKRPTEIFVVDDVPRAATGKVQRVRLRETSESRR